MSPQSCEALGVQFIWIILHRIEKGETAAKELAETTGQRCIFAQADVRKPEQLKAAAKKCIDTFGKIDFVICGSSSELVAFADSLVHLADGWLFPIG